jgi:hypothetical protein
MILSPEESKSFFSNYIPLLFYAAVYDGILPEGSSINDFYETSVEEKLASRDVIFKDADVLTSYEKDNAQFLKTKHPGFKGEVRKGFLKNFVVLKQTKSFAVFMDAEQQAFYHITAITEPIDTKLDYIPAIVETAIFNFGNKLVYDGLLKGGDMRIGPNYKKQFLQDYQKAIKNKQVIELL